MNKISTDHANKSVAREIPSGWRGGMLNPSGDPVSHTKFIPQKKRQSELLANQDKRTTERDDNRRSV